MLGCPDQNTQVWTTSRHCPTTVKRKHSGNFKIQPRHCTQPPKCLYFVRCRNPVSVLETLGCRTPYPAAARLLHLRGCGRRIFTGNDQESFQNCANDALMTLKAGCLPRWFARTTLAATSDNKSEASWRAFPGVAAGWRCYRRSSAYKTAPGPRISPRQDQDFTSELQFEEQRDRHGNP